MGKGTQVKAGGQFSLRRFFQRGQRTKVQPRQVKPGKVKPVAKKEGDGKA